MKKYLLLGIFAILLIQIPFVFSLDLEVCQNVSSVYEDICEDILDLDLSEREKEYLIENLENTEFVEDLPIYEGIFVEGEFSFESDSDYDPKESFNNKFLSMSKLLVLFVLNYSFYSSVKKYFGGALWNVV